MTSAQRKSLDHHLSDYTKDKSFEEVIALIETEDESVLVWQKYENDSPEEIIEYIEDMIDPDELDTEESVGINPARPGVSDDLTSIRPVKLNRRKR